MKPKTENKKLRNKKIVIKKRFIFIPLFLVIVGLIVFMAVRKHESDKFVKVVTVDSIVTESTRYGTGGIYADGQLAKGFIQSVKYSEIAVEKYHVRKGDTVKKGDTLLSYDNSSLQLTLEEQQSQLKITENNIKIADIRINKLKNLKIKPENVNTEVPQIQIPETINPEDTDISAYLQVANENAVYSQTSGNGLQDYVYTEDEIKKMIEDTEQQKEQLSFAKRNIELAIKQTETMLKSGIEKADIDGTVTFVASSDKQAKQKGYHIMITNDNTAFVTTVLSSENLSFISVGTTASAEYTEKSDSTSTEKTMYCDATVTEISDEITENSVTQEISSSVSSDDEYYEVVLMLEENVNISQNSNLIIKFNLNDKNVIRLPSYFIRNDNGKFYVMMANGQNILKKKYIETGKLGDFVEVLSGISRTDRIALPYGKAVEGALAVNSTYREIEQGDSLFF